jgi:hypothetical protein
MSHYTFGQRSCDAIQKYPHILNHINLKKGVGWIGMDSPVKGVYTEWYANTNIDIYRYGATIEKKILKMCTEKLGYRFRAGVEEGDVQNIHLQEGVYWNCDDNGNVWGIYKNEGCDLNIQCYGANIEQQVIQHLRNNPFYYSGTIEEIIF